jgi:hypothetical protein
MTVSDLTLRRRYFGLLKRCLDTHTHTRSIWPPDLAWTKEQVPDFMDAVREAMRRGEVDLRQARVEDREWPRSAQTMVGMYRLDNVQEAVEAVIPDGVPADLIEAEVCPVGYDDPCAGCAGRIRRRRSGRFVADSFCGLSRPAWRRPGRCWRRPPQPELLVGSRRQTSSRTSTRWKSRR